VAFFLSKDVAIKLEFVKGFPHYDFSHLFSNIRDKETGGPIFLIVNEIGEGDGSENYNPIAKFYVEVFRHSGPKFIVISPNKDLPTGSKVATCDRELESTVEAHPGFRTLWRSGGCLFGEIASIGWKKPR